MAPQIDVLEDRCLLTASFLISHDQTLVVPYPFATTGGGTASVTLSPTHSATNFSENFNPDSSFTYTPIAGYIGQDTFRYVVTHDPMPGVLDPWSDPEEEVTIDVVNGRNRSSVMAICVDCC